MLGSDEGIKLVISDGKMLDNILLNVDGIKLGLDVVTELGSLDRLFDCYNHGNIYVLLIRG